MPQYSIVGDAIALRNSPFQSETLVKGRSIGEAIGLLTNYVVDTPPSIEAVNTPPLALRWRWLIHYGLFIIMWSFLELPPFNRSQAQTQNLGHRYTAAFLPSMRVYM